MDACSENLMVIITTNKPMLINPSIRSRCKEIEMPALNADAVLQRAMEIMKAEGVHCPTSHVLHHIKQHDIFGDLRKYMGAIDEMIYAYKMGLIFPTPISSPVLAPTLTLITNN